MQVQRKSSYLYHIRFSPDDRSDTLLPFAITTLKNKGYTFVTVSQCLGISPYQCMILFLTYIWEDSLVYLEHFQGLLPRKLALCVSSLPDGILLISSS